MDTARPRGWMVTDEATGRPLPIAGLEWGHGDRLALLLHANGFCAATWEPVATRLAGHCRIIALDTRGHGASSAPPAPEAYDWRHLVADVRQVVGELLLGSRSEQIALCAGSSLGGVIGAALAAEWPRVFARVVMLDPPIKPRDEMLTELGLEWPSGRRADGIAEQARRRQRVWPSREAAASAWRDKPVFAGWSDRAFELYLSSGLRDRDDGRVELACGPEVEAAIFEMTGSVNLFDRAPRLDAPVHIVRASGSHFPSGLYEALAAKLPRGRVSELEGGHLLPMEAPDAVAALLVRELEGLEQPGALAAGS